MEETQSPGVVLVYPKPMAMIKRVATPIFGGKFALITLTWLPGLNVAQCVFFEA